MWPFTLAFCLAIIAVALLPQLAGSTIILTAGALAILLILGVRWQRWLWTGLVFGLFWGGLDRLQDVGADLRPSWEGLDLIVEGRVDDLPERRGRALRFYLEVDRIVPADEPEAADGHAPKRIRLSWYDASARPGNGERWRFKVRLKRLRGFANPHGFDYAAWLRSKSVNASGYVRRDTSNERLSEAPPGLADLRQRLSDRLALREAVGPVSGIVAALALGDRSGLDRRQWRRLAATGTGHLVAISGLHVGLVAFWGGWWMGLLWSRLPVRSQRLSRQQVAAVGGVVFALLYAALAGFSVPTQRALILVVVVALSIGLRRSPAPGRALALALLLILLWEPGAVLGPGLWLSFGAVAVILFGMSARVAQRGWWWRWGRVQWLAAFGLLPLLLLWFQRSSLVSPLANLIAVPLVGLLVVPLVLPGTLLLPVWPMGGEWLLGAAEFLLRGLWLLLGVLQGLPGAEWVVAALPWYVLLSAAFGVFWWLLPRGWPARWLAAVALLPVLLYRSPAPPQGGLWFTLLDVGQGLAAVLRTRTHTLVYDTGPAFGGGFDTGWAVLGPYLDAEGISLVDRLVVSNADRDHAGGAASLLERWKVDDIISGADPQRLRLPGDRPCLAGEQWDWDGVSFRFLHPPTATAFRGNDRSCVLRVQTAGGGSLLLTGDIELRAERSLLGSNQPLSADVLVVPHHGSRSSSTAAFIAAVDPKVALFATGYRNRFGFPKEDVVRRYAVAGAQTLSTHERGAIELRYEPGRGWSDPLAYRDRQRRPWSGDAGR